MNETVHFIDQSGAKPGAMDLWPAIVIPKETIDAEIERLASLPRPANGRRRSIIAGPMPTRSPIRLSRHMKEAPRS